MLIKRKFSRIINLNMKEMSLRKIVVSMSLTFIAGLAFGWCIGYFPVKEDMESKEYSFKYYRDKYLKECEMYDYIQKVACDQTINDAYKLYLIRSTYTKDDHFRDIESALKLKRSLERNNIE